jgi:hypothetical protein
MSGEKILEKIRYQFLPPGSLLPTHGCHASACKSDIDIIMWYPFFPPEQCLHRDRSKCRIPASHLVMQSCHKYIAVVPTL